MEKLYDNDRELWFDIQLETTECDKCGVDIESHELISD